MELKVWVEGIQRIVCGVTEATTCQDVVFALAHATGKSGRFTLIERWRCNERLLAPNEQPLKILSKWGEYSSDVQFILHWNDGTNKNISPIQNQLSPNLKFKINTNNTMNLSTNISTISVESPEKSKIIFNSANNSIEEHNLSMIKNTSTSSSSHNKGVLEDVDMFENTNITTQKQQTDHNHSSPYTNDTNITQQMSPPLVAPPYKDPPNPHAPPPYRNPPSPQNSTPISNNNFKQRKNYIKDINRPLSVNSDENALYNTQYKELVQLVNYQREKISIQQADLTKYDAEIVFWETKGREQQGRLNLIAQELVKVSNISRINSDKIKALNYIEEENEIVRQQEKILKSEITLLRSKLANCETELLQCKNKIRLLMDELQLEKRAQMRLGESQIQLERSLLTEVERLQHELELANQGTERNQATADVLKREVAILEVAIVEKKKEVESLVNEMKEANLLSLSITSTDEIRHLLEGPIKAGSTRKIIGSPRQLENAVPTNKNPHGVWV